MLSLFLSITSDSHGKPKAAFPFRSVPGVSFQEHGTHMANQRIKLFDFQFEDGWLVMHIVGVEPLSPIIVEFTWQTKVAFLFRSMLVALSLSVPITCDSHDQITLKAIFSLLFPFRKDVGNVILYFF